MSQPKMKRLAQLSKVSKTRGLMLWTFWENTVDAFKKPFVATQIDGFGNTRVFEYATKDAMREGYRHLRDDWGYVAVN